MGGRIVAGGVAAAVGATALIAAGTAAAQQAPVATAAPSTGVEEVVVTASKRAERVQDTPEAVSVVTDKTIENLNIQNFQDYASLVPNLNQAGGAGLGSGTIVLRGLNTGPQSLTQTTAVYLDEAPFTASGSFSVAAFQTPDPDLVDIDHVEVLKGPQGTLYGASSLGGLIRIIPKSPDLNGEGVSGDLRVSGDVAQGGDLGYGLRGSVYDTLVPGKLAIGLSAFDRQDPGFITNVENGNDHEGRAHEWGGMFSLAASPVDNLTIQARVMSESGKQIGALEQENETGTGTPLYGQREYSSPIDGDVKPHYELYEFSADYKTPVGTVTGVVSHTVNQLKEFSDYTTSYGVLLNIYYPALTGGAPPAGANVTGPILIDNLATNEEIRFTSNRLWRFEFIVGGYHTDQTSNYVIDIFGNAANGSSLPAPFNNLATTDTRTTYHESAGFGDLTFYILDNLDLTGGIRYAANEQTGEVTGDGLLFATPQATNLSSTGQSTLYQVDLRWRPSQDLSFYARVATGYRPGGPQNNPLAPNPTFQPDTVTDYEIGAKGAFFDRRLTFDGSIYHMNWNNVQLDSLLGGIVYVGNAGAAKIDGVELQSTFAATRNWSFGGAFGYNNARLTSIGDTTAVYLGAQDGDRLPNSPRVTFAAYGDYAFPVGERMKGDLGATVKYQGDQVSAFPDDPLNVYYKMPGYATLDLRASLAWSRYTVRAGIQNVTDTNGYTGYATSQLIAGQGSPSFAYLIRPRTFSMSFDVTF